MTVLTTRSGDAPDLPSARVPFADLTGMHAPLATEFDAVWAQLIATSGFIGGPLVDAFETSWAAYCGRKHAVGVANGTDAIALVLKAFQVSPGDEVLVPANTFIASAEGVVMAGAKPVFVDVDPQTLLVDVELLEAAMTPRTVAVLVVHLYGHIPDMDAISAFAKRRGLAVIEDAAQAHGATWNGRPAGSFGRRHDRLEQVFAGARLGVAASARRAVRGARPAGARGAGRYRDRAVGPAVRPRGAGPADRDARLRRPAAALAGLSS